MKSKVLPQMVVNDVHLLPIISTGVMIFGMVGAYVIALALDHVEPVFPFISHVVAYPPQSALGVIFGSAGSVLGFLSLILRYVVIDHRGRALAEDKKQSVDRLNKAALWCGILSYISMLIVMLNPVGFPWDEKYDFILIVAVPHHLGDLGVLVFFSSYVFIEAYLTFTQRTTYKQNVFVQHALVVGVIASICGILLTIYSALTDAISSVLMDETAIAHFIYRKYSFDAVICAVSEWFFVVMCLVFVATFYRDFKNVKIEFYLKSKKCKK